jgi:nitroreductase/NAD-dependent dihydropyrimidine dehydrogenase PreA subunit
MNEEITIDTEKCAGCGSCASVCTNHIISIKEGKARVRNNCLKCGHCYAICPQKAISLGDDETEEVSGQPAFVDAAALRRHLKLRRSIRRYKNIPVEKEKIEKILDAGRITPTASNAQNVRYIVIQDEINSIEDAVLKQYNALKKPALFLQRFIKLPYDVRRFVFKRGFLFHNAPCVILIISKSDINACLAAMSMELMAESLGLGTLYVGLFTIPAKWNRKLRKRLSIAKKEKIAVCLALGYSSVQFLRSAPRKKAEITWL